MTIHYGFSWEGGDGLVAYTVGEEKRVHFGEIGKYEGYEKVPVTGDTYPVKDNIKSTEWENTHYSWTGDVWVVDASGLREVIESVLERVDEVSAHVDTVHECGALSEFHDKVQVSKDSDDVMSFQRKPLGNKDGVPESWAKDAAKLGNFDSVDEFADRFNLEVLPDSEFTDYELGEDEGDGGLPGSMSGMTTG